MSRAFVSALALLAAGPWPAYAAYEFVTSLSSPIATVTTPVGSPGTSTLDMVSLADIDSEVRFFK